MAIEAKRGCGFRKVGGLYLVGDGPAVICDRLPLEIIPCPTCGEAPRFHRGISKINPFKLWGDHTPGECWCDAHPDCVVCQPSEKAFLMWVGTEYDESSFIREAHKLGVSKRIPQMPKELQLGVDWIFLAYKRCVPKDEKAKIARRQMSLLSAHEEPRASMRKGEWAPGVFYVFKPRRIEKIVTQTQAQDDKKMTELRKQGITPVVVPDDDPDHNPRAAKTRSSGDHVDAQKEIDANSRAFLDADSGSKGETERQPGDQAPPGGAA